MAFSVHTLRRQLWWIAVLVGLLLASTAAAQTGGVQIIDPDNLLGGQRAQVEQAAQQLAGQGAQVVVVAAGSSGSTGTDPEQALFTALQQNNIQTVNGRPAPNQIIFYVNTARQYTGLYYGSRWRATFDPVYQSIVREQITPAASAGDVATGFINGINAARTTLDPPTPPLFYALGGVLLLTVIGLVAAPILRRRREAATTLTTAHERATQARREAGAAIADLGQRMETARAKAQYDALSYAPADAQRIQAAQRRAEDLFAQAQAAFDAAEEQDQLDPDEDAADYQKLAAGYEQARALTNQAAAALSDVEQQRAALDANTNASPMP